MVKKKTIVFFSCNVLFCRVCWLILKKRSEKKQSSTRRIQNTGSFLLSRGLVNRAEIFTHKAATVLLITHIVYWSIGVVLHVEVETTTLSTRLSRKLNRHLRFSANVICEEAMQHSSTLRTPTLVSYYIVVSCPRKMRQFSLIYASSLFPSHS